MNRVLYKAITPSKEQVNGIFNGSSQEFQKFVVDKNLIVLSFKEDIKKLKKGKFTQDDFLSMIEELYYLVKSGMSIDKALKLLLTTSSKESQIKLLNAILKDVKEGVQLSIALKNSLSSEGVKVDALSIGFVATAEEVGDLRDGLLQLFDYLTFQKGIRGDIKQALSYPMFLMGMSVVVSFLIFFLIIPKFSTIFSPEEFERLPSISYGVLSLGTYLNDNMMMVLAIIGGFVSLIIFYVKKKGINWLGIFYNTPKLRDLVIDIQLSIIYGALSNMLKGGLELDRALRQLNKIKLLSDINDLISNALLEIKRGVKLSEVFALSSIIPPSDIALLYVGESSASMPEIFKSLSTRHAQSFNQGTKKILAILEPAVIVALGIFIAVIIVAIMLAVMSISDIAG
ncbi:General secretion pathway protein F [hydrothermal vent metagenome]|uniref:General secretion pathway protein F n=1 Tax=hydrothermal vent metagenome TaxID=652676 RepID=A0A1W1EKJ1_9ZZZZ